MGFDPTIKSNWLGLGAKIQANQVYGTLPLFMYANGTYKRVAVCFLAMDFL